MAFLGPVQDQKGPSRSSRGLSKATTGTSSKFFQAYKGPSQANSGPHRPTRALSGHHEVFLDRQNNLLGLLKPIQDPRRPAKALSEQHRPSHTNILLSWAERGHLDC